MTHQESYPQRLRGELLALVIDRYGDIDRIKTVQQAEKAITKLIVESLGTLEEADITLDKPLPANTHRNRLRYEIKALWEPSKEGER